MGLDINFTQCKKVVCPHCNTVVRTEEVSNASSGGRGWYEILATLGYYVPYEQRTEENDWYGKDMVLTREQTKLAYDFVKGHPDLYYGRIVLGLLAAAIVDEDDVVINADW